MRTFLFLTGFLLFACVSYEEARGSECGIRRIVVTRPVIHQAHIVPTYNYNHYKEQVILVPKAIQVEVQREHYYSIDSATQQSLLADAIVGRLLRFQLEGKVGTPAVPVPPALGGRPSSPPNVSVGGAPASAVDKAGDYQNEALLKVVNDNCVKCHGAGSKHTRLVSSDGKLNDLPAGKIWECFGLVNTGEMPKGGKALKDEEVKLFYDWAKNARK